jgi:hypothetical protein
MESYLNLLYTITTLSKDPSLQTQPRTEFFLNNMLSQDSFHSTQRRLATTICTSPTSVVDEIFRSRNFAKYLFRISRNICFISRNFVSRKLQNFVKYREIFVTKLNFGRVRKCLNFLPFQYTKKITFMSKVHKYLYVSGSVFSGTDPMIRIHAKILRIRNSVRKVAVIMTSCFSKFN